MLSICRKAGVKDQPLALLLTDNHIVADSLLPHLCSLMEVGDPGVALTPEERDAIHDGVRLAVKSGGLLDSPANCWAHFTRRIRANLRVILCLSPASKRFLRWSQQYPTLFSLPTMDWYQPWSQKALLAVARHLLRDLLAAEPEIGLRTTEFVAAAHAEVLAANERYWEQFAKRNHTTSRSFLEFVQLFSSMLAAKREELWAARARLEQGKRGG